MTINPVQSITYDSLVGKSRFRGTEIPIEGEVNLDEINACFNKVSCDTTISSEIVTPSCYLWMSLPCLKISLICWISYLSLNCCAAPHRYLCS